ncbi:MAG: cysteine desulfurase family protein, partial [Candidatus Omnitrophota bacterium]
MKSIYFDANATTRVAPEVAEEMMPFFKERYGNASSSHAMGRDAKKYLEKARKQAAELIGCTDAEEIVFTSGGTESNNLAIKGAVRALEKKRKHIITSKVEHPAVLKTCECLEKEGHDVTYLDVDKWGSIDPEALKRAITAETALITVMAANNETGTIMPVEKIREIASEKGIYFHTDGVQYIGKIISGQNCPCADLISFSSHKINGPKGAGALYIKKGVKIDPLFHGGHQEKEQRAGTENIAGIVGFGKACELALKEADERYSKVIRMRDKLYEGVLALFDNAVLNGHPEKRLPNTLNICLKGFDGESLVMAMDLEGICISTGAACRSGSTEGSHVLKAMGLNREEIKSAVRISLDRYNSEEEIRIVLDKLRKSLACIEKAKSIG